MLWCRSVKTTLAAFLAFILGVGFFAPNLAFAQQANPDLNLSSTDRTVSASGFQGLSSASIQIGEHQRTIVSSDFLTPAESIALQQVLAGGRQLIQLSEAGAAIGGSINLGSGIAALFGQTAIANLVIPAGVTAIHDFGSAATLNLTGNLTNAGNFYAISSNSAVTAANINAANIFNQQGGLLSSVLPSGGLVDYGNLGNLVSNFSLNLTAVNDIINGGAITSSGNLAVIAGGTIVNALPSGAVGTLPIMQAVNNLNVQALSVMNAGVITSQTGSINMILANLQNAGLIQSLASNINVVNSIDPSLGLHVVQGELAKMEALNGAISFNVTDQYLKKEMNISGGELLSLNGISFNDGEGYLKINLSDVSGPVDIHAGMAEFAVTAGTHGMYLRTFDITGDPNIIYTGNGPYVSGAVNTDGGFVNINTSADTVNGSITFTGDIVTTPIAAGAGGAVTLNAGTSIVARNITTSANTSGNAGDISLTSASTLLQITGSLTANGASSGNGGNVTVNYRNTNPFIVGGSSVNSYISGNINSNAPGSGAGGNITISNGLSSNLNITLTGTISANTSSGSMGNLIFNKPGRTVTVSGPGALVGVVTASGSSVSLNPQLTGSVLMIQNITATGVGAISLTASSNGQSIILVDGCSISGGGAITIATPTLSFGAGSTISTTSVIANISLTSGGGAFGLSIVLPDSSSATIATGGGLITMTPTAGQTLTVSKAAGVGTTVLNLNGAVTTTTTVNTVINSGVTLLSNNAITIRVNGGTLINNGTISSVRAGTPGSVSILSTGTLTVNSTGSILAYQTISGDAGAVSITATGALTFSANPSFNLNGNGVSSNGGSLTIRGSTLAFTGVLTGLASATGSGNGGSIDISTTNSASDLVVNSSTFSLFANGGSSGSSAGNGGSITIAAGRHLTVDPSVLNVAPQGNAGNGGGFSFAAGASAGILTLASNLFNLDAAGGDSNGGSFTISGSTYTVPGILTVSANATGTGNGGNISVTTTSLSFDITVNATTFNLSATGGSVGSSSGGGGTISFNTRRNLTVDVSILNIAPLGNNGNGGGLSFTALNTVTLNTNIFNLNGKGSDSNGGSFALSGSAFVIPGTVIVNANATGSGNGGNISVSLTPPNAGNFIVDSGSFSLSATGGSIGSNSGNGGTISLLGPVGLIVDPSVLNVAPLGNNGSGGNLYLRHMGSIFGTLRINGSLIVDGVGSGNGGIIRIDNSGNGNIFSIGGAVGNDYITGAISANAPGAGSGGAIIIISPYISGVNGVVSASGSSGGSITLGQPGGSSYFGSMTLATASSGSVIFPDAGFNYIYFNSDLAYTFNGGGTISITGSNISFLGPASIIASGASTVNINGLSGAFSITLTSPTGSIAAISTNGGAINFSTGLPGSAAGVVFAQTGAGAASLNLTGGPVTLTTGNVTVNAGVSIFADNTITMNINSGLGGTLANNGTISSVGTLTPGALVVQSTAGLTINPVGNIIVSQATTGSAGTLSFIATGALTLGSNTFNLNGTGANSNGGAFTISGSTISVPGILTVGANATGTGNGGSISVTTTANTSDITIDAATFNLTARGGSAGSVSGNGGSITLSAGRSLLVTNPSVLSAVPLGTNGNGATFALTSGGTAGAVNPLLQFNSAINANGVGTGNGGTVTINYNNNAATVLTIGGAVGNSYINGAISANAPGTGLAGSVQILANGGVSISGVSASITATGSSSGVITMQASSAAANTLTLSGTLSLASSATGSITFNSRNVGGTISVLAGTVCTINGGPTITISSPTFSLGGNAQLTASGASNIGLDSGGGAANLTIRTLTGSNATLSTAGGAFSIIPTAGRQLIFSQTGAGTSTLNLNGGSVTTTTANGATVVNTGVILSSNNTITMNVNGSTLTNNGTITSSRVGTPGAVTIQSTSSLVISALGTISAVTNGGGNGGNVSILAATTLSIPFGTISTSATGAGNFNGGTTTISTTALTVTGAGVLTLNSDALGTGNGGTINITSSGATGSITLGSANGNIQAFARGGTVASAAGNGGIVNLTAGAGITLSSGSFLDVSPRGNNGNGGNITLSAGSAAAGNIALNAALNASGIGSGNGGSVTVTQNAAGSNITLTGSVVSAYKGASGTTNGSINMSIAGTGAGVFSMNNTSTIQGDAITLTSTTITVNGTVTSTTADGTITLQSNGALTLNGTPAANIAVTGGGSNALVTVQASGANALTFSTSHTFDAGASGMVYLQSPSAGGSVVVAAAVNVTVPNSWALEVITPTLTLNNTSQIRATGSGQYIELASGNLAMTINLPGGAGQSATVQNTNGYILVGPYGSGVNLSFNAAAASTLNLNAQSVQTWAINGTTTVAANATVASTGNITMNADGGSIQVLGTLQSTLNGGYITFQGWGSNLTMSGTPGTVRFTGGAVGTISLLTAGLGNTINLNSGYTFNPGTNGQVLISSSNISVANSTTVTATSTSTLSITTNNLTLGSASVLTTNKTTGTALTISALDNSSALTITGTTGSTTGVISTSGGDILTTSNALTFAQTGAGTTTINLNTGSGGTVYTNTNTGNTTINSGVTVSMNGNLDMQVWGGGSLVNNGTITSTKNAGSLLITGNANFTMSGTGTYSVSGTGVNTISIIAYGANFNINNNTTLNAGASGIVNVGSANQNIILGNNVTVQSTNGSLMNIQASSLTFGNNAVISTTKSSGVGINVYSGSNQPLTITAPSGSSAGILTDGGSIDFYSDGAMTFAKSAAGNTTLNLGDANSGNTNINSWNTTTINGGVNILSAKTMTFNVQRATVGANGQLNTTNGSISLVAQTGTLSIGANAIIYANEGNLVIQNVDTVGGSISFGSAANIDAFTISNPVLGNVTVFIGNSAGAPVDGSTPANVTVNESGGGQVYFGTNGITASGPTNTITGKGRNVQFSTGSGPATLISLGGSVTIDADPPDPIDVYLLEKPPGVTISSVSLPNTGSSVTGFDLSVGPIMLPSNNRLMVSNELGIEELLMAVPAFNADMNQEGEQDIFQSISFLGQGPNSSLKMIMPEVEAGVANETRALQEPLDIVGTDAGDIMCNGQSKIALVKDGNVILKQGEMLVSSIKAFNLQCNSITVNLKANTLFLIQKQGNITKLYNLYEKSAGSANVIVDSRQIELSAGQELVIGPNHNFIASALQNDGLGRRKSKQVCLSQTYSLFSSEVSLITLMHKGGNVLPVLLKNSVSNGSTIRNKLVKMAACLMVVSGAHGAYHAKP